MPQLEVTQSYDDYVMSVSLLTRYGSDIAANVIHDEWARISENLETDTLLPILFSFSYYCQVKDHATTNLAFVMSALDAIEERIKTSTPDANDELARVANNRGSIMIGVHRESAPSDRSLLLQAVDHTKRAAELDPAQGSYLYNLALMYHEAAMPTEANDSITRLLVMDQESGEEHGDHLEAACQIYYKASDNDFRAAFARLQSVNPYAATMISRKLK
ncbi:MAG: hypothetical protein LBV00_09520 [Propionibacteriaceae bacterium]|nr:hypothetical protein [Propionibacteriaceae bacterium]